MGLKIENFTINYRPDSESEGYDWEKVDLDWWRFLIAEHFYQFIPLIGILYLAGIYFGQMWMKGQSPFELKRPLVFWNTSLAIFSTIVAYKGYTEMYTIGKIYGMGTPLCKRVLYNKSIGIWSLAFIFSKLIELGDTVFLVLRKKKVIILHWFHHFAVLNSAFYIFPKFEPVSLTSGPINAGVHSLMYTYFAFMAAGVKIPKKISMAITAAQIAQFLAGSTLIVYVMINRFYERTEYGLFAPMK